MRISWSSRLVTELNGGVNEAGHAAVAFSRINTPSFGHTIMNSPRFVLRPVFGPCTSVPVWSVSDEHDQTLRRTGGSP